MIDSVTTIRCLSIPTMVPNHTLWLVVVCGGAIAPCKVVFAARHARRVH